jgi:hypothetical protein
VSTRQETKTKGEEVEEEEDKGGKSKVGDVNERNEHEGQMNGGTISFPFVSCTPW